MFLLDNKTCMNLDSGRQVPNSEACALIAQFVELLFEICFECDINKIIDKMPSVPQGAFAACKVRERNMKIVKIQAMEQESEKMFYNGKYLELSPLKYNSKLMNSIWGLYNRYSVHNFKKNTDAADAISAAETRKIASYSAAGDKSSIGNKGLKSSSVLVSEWINIWGTHKH